MTGYDLNGPYISLNELDTYISLNYDIACDYGMFIKAKEFSNKEYKMRFQKFSNERKMKPPPSSDRMLSGYLVIRNLDKSDEYETWMTDIAFNGCYKNYGS